MRTLPPLILLTSCLGSSAPLPVGPLDEPGGVPVIDLQLRPGRWSLPSTPAAVRQASFTLGQPRPGGSNGRRTQWKYQLPFAPGPDDERFAPAGLRVLADDAPLPWLQNVVHRDGWRIIGADLVVFAQDRPERLQVEHPALALQEKRLSPIDSGLAPDAYVHGSLTLGQQTRAGLYLPDGAIGTWTVAVPEGGSFRAAVARVPAQRTGASLLSIAVVQGGQSAPVAERATPAEGFEAWTVDLSAYAGQTVDLTVSAAGTTGSLSFLAHPEIVGGRADTAPRRVLWIGLDTTRRDRLGLYGYQRPTTPKLDKWAATGTIYTNAVTPAPRTRPSFRSALTGRRPLDGVGAPTFLSVLDKAGFATAGIVANVHLNQRFGFTQGSDAWWLDPQARASTQVDRAWSWLSEHADQDSALFVHFMDPHSPYDPPEPHRTALVRARDPALPRSVIRSTLAKWTAQHRLSTTHKAYVSDLYDAELAGLDDALGALFDRVATLPGSTIIVVHSDHGEEFWDHGGFDHNHTLKPELVDAALILKIPGKPAGSSADPVALMDLVPTVLQAVGVPGPPSDGLSLLGPISPDRPLDIAHLMYDTERWAVRSGQHSYVLWTGSGEQAIYDRVADPTEDRPIDPPAELRQHLQQQLALVHGIDVGPGWRATVELAGEPVRWILPRPALGAGVLDPESLSAKRANQVWGEQPEIRASDVAKVTLSPDGLTLDIVPGPGGKGTLWIRFAGPTGPGGEVQAGGRRSQVRGGPQLGAAGFLSLDVREGTILVPPVGEADRLRALTGDLGAVDPTTRALLQDLGYVKGSGSTAP